MVHFVFKIWQLVAKTLLTYFFKFEHRKLKIKKSRGGNCLLLPQCSYAYDELVQKFQPSLYSKVGRFGKNENDSIRFIASKKPTQSRKHHARIITLMKSTNGQGTLNRPPVRSTGGLIKCSCFRFFNAKSPSSLGRSLSNFAT